MKRVTIIRKIEETYFVPDSWPISLDTTKIPEKYHEHTDEVDTAIVEQCWQCGNFYDPTVLDEDGNCDGFDPASAVYTYRTPSIDGPLEKVPG